MGSVNTPRDDLNGPGWVEWKWEDHAESRYLLNPSPFGINATAPLDRPGTSSIGAGESRTRSPISEWPRPGELNGPQSRRRSLFDWAADPPADDPPDLDVNLKVFGGPPSRMSLDLAAWRRSSLGSGTGTPRRAHSELSTGRSASMSYADALRAARGLNARSAGE